MEKWAMDAINKQIECYMLVFEFFNKNLEKTALWFRTPNRNFGGSSPHTLIDKGRADKLLLFIKNAIDENKLEEE